MADAQKAICHKCNEIIENRIISALGKDWHPEHFACKDCNKPIIESTFNMKGGEPVCSNCFVKNYSSTCFGCHGPILERTIKAMGQTWHQECFCCAGPCHKQLIGTSFYEREGKPYCHEDFQDLFAARCAGCGDPVVDSVIAALNAKWHRDCFKCKDCAKPILEATFVVRDEQPVCKVCSN